MQAAEERYWYQSRALGQRSEILPRRLYRQGGASVVRRVPLQTERGSRMSKLAKKRLTRTSAKKQPAGKHAERTDSDQTAKRPDRASKQSRVIAMLHSPEGTTIAAMMKATSWQQHSVRGFLAGTVRKRLELKLESEVVDGKRVYRIVDAPASLPAAAKIKRRSA
jgi:hypothetical protein